MIFTSTFLTLDGVMSDPEVWHPPFSSAESIELLADQLDSVDAMLLGRITSDEFAALWPPQPDAVPLARRTNEITKWVATSGESIRAWPNAGTLDGEPIEAIARLRDDGVSMMVPGSATLVRSLLAVGLVDEMRVYLDPVVVGTGRRLFELDGNQHRCTLADARSLPNGVHYLAYRLHDVR